MAIELDTILGGGVLDEVQRKINEAFDANISDVNGTLSKGIGGGTVHKIKFTGAAPNTVEFSHNLGKVYTGFVVVDYGGQGATFYNTRSQKDASTIKITASYGTAPLNCAILVF